VTVISQDEKVVVVIGSGAGGATVAHELCRKGIQCVLLEAGPAIDSKDFVNDEFVMANRLTWADERTMSGDAHVAKAHAGPTWTCKSLGGTTTFWAGCCPRFQEHELRASSTYGEIKGATLRDWPLGLEDLLPYYVRAEDKMGVTRTHGIPPLPGNNNFLVMREGAKRVGYSNVTTGRMAINSEPRDGRSGCLQLGFCIQGCKSKAKWSTLYTEIPKARDTGRFELRTRSMAIRIEHDDQGKVDAVVYADSKGSLHRQKARMVCVAANAVETSRLLLNSDSSRFPRGLANSSDELGRNYTTHTSGFVFALFDEPVNMHRGATMAGFVEDEIVHRPDRGFVGGYRFETCSVGLPMLAATWPYRWGEEFADIMENYDHLAGLWICGEDMPMKTNRVTLNPERVDTNGMPIPHVHLDEHPNDKEMLEHAYRSAEKMYRAVGARKVLRVPPFPAGHNMGVARMSDDPEHGVLNKFGQSHDVENLFISDGSTFTTSGAANPTLTIVALAIRQADYIASQMAADKI